jgi:hypothetical protein
MKRHKILIGIVAATFLVALIIGSLCVQRSAAQGEPGARTIPVDTAPAERLVANGIGSNPACLAYDLSASGESTIEVPSFCIDGMCTISVYHEATMGAFGPGLSWPAYYMQSSADDSWVGGPNISLAGVSFSAGGGVNGDRSSEAIFSGGTTTDGGYVRLYDDGGSESSADLWTIESMPSALLTNASLHVCAVASCVQHDVSAEAEYAIELPDFCIDGICTVLMWHDATFGAFGPGLSWPVYYEQSSADDSWIGGPNVSIGGVALSDGGAVNGDGSGDDVFFGGVTDGGGYLRLLDDGTPEHSPELWTIDFSPADDLTAGSIYICSMPSCEQHDVSVEAELPIEVPDFCVDGMCTVLMWSDATFGAFGPGLSWPVQYSQSSMDDSWIGGANLSIGGVSLSAGGAVNGDTSGDGILLWGQTVGGGYASLYDDGTPESSPYLWTIDFSPTVTLTQASFYICPGSCVQSKVLLYRLYLPLVIRG